MCPTRSPAWFLRLAEGDSFLVTSGRAVSGTCWLDFFYWMGRILMVTVPKKLHSNGMHVSLLTFHI